MKFSTSIAAAMTMVMIAASTAAAQSFLERLEGIIGGNQPPAVSENREPGYLGLTVDRGPGGGVLVTEVAFNGPAAQAGLAKGDRVVMVNGAAIGSVDDMADALQGLFADDRFEIKFERGGKQQTATVTLASPPPQPPALERLERQMEELASPPRATDTRSAMLGVRVGSLTQAVRERFNLAVENGAVVEHVSRGSPADRAQLPVGAAIVAFNGQRVDSPEQLTSLLRSARPGSEVELSYYQGRQLVRTRVRLAAAPPREDPLRLDGPREPLVPEPPLAQPPVDSRRPIFSGERPARRILNRVLEEVEQAQQPPRGADPGELQQHIEALEGYIDTLEARIRELESELQRRPTVP